MRNVAVVIVAAAALMFAGGASADPGLTPHGGIGACNGMTPANDGMNNAVNHANANGIDGMIRSIERTSPFGPPDFCP